LPVATMEAMAYQKLTADTNTEISIRGCVVSRDDKRETGGG